LRSGPAASCGRKIVPERAQEIGRRFRLAVCGYKPRVRIVLCLLLVAVLGAGSPDPLSAFRVADGPFAGAYRMAPTGGINWYFLNVSLYWDTGVPVENVRDALDLELRLRDPVGQIWDEDPSKTQFVAIGTDSDDAYAATFISLAVAYRRRSHDETWWNANVTALKAIAHKRILEEIAPNGLTRASFRNPTAYLMDNVEVYVGLRDLVDALHETHDPDAAYFERFVLPLGNAIAGLYDPAAHAYRWSNIDPLPPYTAYPTCAAQTFPELYGVRSSNPAQDAARARTVRQTIGQRCPPFDPVRNQHELLMFALDVERFGPRSARENHELAVARGVKPADLLSVAFENALVDPRP